MYQVATGILVGLLLAVSVYAALKGRSRHRPPNNRTPIQVSIEQMRSVGELVAFKVVTKEVVTRTDHWFGEVGRKYFEWLVSSKKIVMIFEFEIDFRYDLRSREFVIESRGEHDHVLHMPPCYYGISLRNVSFYDEQKAEILPLFVPELVSRLFDRGFDEHGKNQLVEEAKVTAAEMAKSFVRNMRSEVQTSARQTLEVLAKGFGAEHVAFDFSDADLVGRGVQSVAFETAVAKSAPAIEGQTKS